MQIPLHQDRLFQTRNAKGTTVEGLLPYSGVESSDLKQRHATEVVEKFKQLITIAQKRKKIVANSTISFLLLASIHHPMSPDSSAPTVQ